MTTRIYYTDPYCRRFDAIVVKTLDLDGRAAAILDRTAFYPVSGGQPFDTGRLAGVDVIETLGHEDAVIHVLSAPLLEGTRAIGELDWPRRFDHMQQHTGQHLLSAAFDRLFSDRTTSFHMGAETATIDLAREVSWAQIGRAEDEANRVVWENREVSIRFVTTPEAAGLPLRKEPAREGTIRLIEVKDFDLSACGGTHVARTGAIGAIVVLAAEKFRGGTRMTFACGGRAVGAFRTLRESVAGSVRVLSVLPQDIPQAIERMQANAKESRQTIKTLQSELAGHEVDRLIAAALTIHDSLVVVETLDGWDVNGLKAIASAITSRRHGVAALFSTASPFAVVIARSVDVPLDANAILRALAERFGGRGGGKPDLAQGGGLGGELAEIVASARELLMAAFLR